MLSKYSALKKTNPEPYASGFVEVYALTFFAVNSAYTMQAPERALRSRQQRQPSQ